MDIGSSRIAATAGIAWTILMSASVAHSQPCQDGWLPGEGLPGVGGHVNASIMWDADGDGPADPLLVLGGSFAMAGDQMVPRIAGWNPSTGDWIGFGFPATQYVRALAVDSQGGLLVGAGHRVWRLNEGEWTQIGGAFENGSSSAEIEAICVYPGGDIVVGGAFTSVGGQPVSRVARWNGQDWHSIGQLPSSVNALLLESDDRLTAGTADGAWTWEGGSWERLDPTLRGPVFEVFRTSSGELLLGGDFLPPFQAQNVVRWTGSAWEALGSGLNSHVYAIAELDDGSIVSGGLPSSGIGVAARWDGSTWTPFVAFTNGAILSFCRLVDESLIAGGAFLHFDLRIYSRASSVLT